MIVSPSLGIFHPRVAIGYEATQANNGQRHRHLIPTNRQSKTHVQDMREEDSLHWRHLRFDQIASRARQKVVRHL